MYYNKNSKWHIVFPCGDKTRLSVVEICNGLEYELSDYSVASRNSFDNPMDAHLYAKDLADKHKLDYRADTDVVGHEANYLD